MDDTTMNDAEPALLFHGLTFTIIPNELDESIQREVEDDITAAGGTVLPFDAARGKIDNLKDLSYIIAATSDFPDFHKAMESFLPVVKPSWVAACINTQKVKNPRQYNPDPALFMGDVVVCCGQCMPSGDREAIEGGVVAMGGQYTPTLSKLVTHIISLDYEDPRCQLALQKRLPVAIVLPHWFDDCLRVGKRLSERPYMLPNPEILDVTAGPIPPSRASREIRDASNPEPTTNPSLPAPLSTSEPDRAIRAFHERKVMLSADLSISNRLRSGLAGLIAAGGGEVVDNVDKADMYVCNYREGEDYVKASQAGKDVGNLSWLYYMITYNTWTNPMRRMLHYPRPRDGIPGFRNYKISISSYTGEARVYLENLVKACGAEFTKTFKQDNTHLITAHKHSEKCEAAEEWGVHIVNSLWLEESYSACKEQTLTDPRFTYFPSRTNLGEILGQVELDREAVEQNFYSETRKPAPKASAKASKPPTASVPARAVSGPDPVTSPLVSNSRRTKTVPDVATPVAQRVLDDKENETPGTTGSRGAKSRALSKLHDAADDIAKFEREMKRKGGVIHGGRRDKDVEVAEKPRKSSNRDSISSKRSVEDMDVDGASGDDVASEPAQKGKKTKKPRLMPIKHRMLLTKDDRWADNKDKETKDKAQLRELGLHIVDDWGKADLLCAPRIVRTPKFVAALASAPTVVGSSYLDYALKHNELPAPEKHLLKNPEFERQYGFRLDESLERAKQNRGRLLRDWTIFCTDGVAGGFDAFNKIVAANGGICMKWKGRTTALNATKRSIDVADKEVSQNQVEDEGDVLYLLSEATEKEAKLWPKFRDLAKKHDMVPRIVTTEWLLFVAMAQYVHWDPEWELKEERLKMK